MRGTVKTQYLPIFHVLARVMTVGQEPMRMNRAETLLIIDMLHSSCTWAFIENRITAYPRGFVIARSFEELSETACHTSDLLCWNACPQ